MPIKNLSLVLRLLGFFDFLAFFFGLALWTLLFAGFFPPFLGFEGFGKSRESLVFGSLAFFLLPELFVSRSQKPRKRRTGSNIRITVKCGNHLRVGVRAENASGSGFYVPAFLSKGGFQRKTKGQQLKGKIVSEFFTLFHNFSPRTFPFKTKGFSSRRTKEKKR